MRYTRYIAVPAAAALISVAAACGTHGTAGTGTGAPPAALASSAAAIASVPGADARAMLIKAGVPVNGTPLQQITFAKSMLTKANRDTLAQKLEIPKASRPGFEAAVLGDFEAAVKSGAITTHDGRVALMDSLAGLVGTYQA